MICFLFRARAILPQKTKLRKKHLDFCSESPKLYTLSQSGYAALATLGTIMKMSRNTEISIRTTLAAVRCLGANIDGLLLGLLLLIGSPRCPRPCLLTA